MTTLGEEATILTKLAQERIKAEFLAKIKVNIMKRAEEGHNCIYVDAHKALPITRDSIYRYLELHLKPENLLVIRSGTSLQIKWD